MTDLDIESYTQRALLTSQDRNSADWQSLLFKAVKGHGAHFEVWPLLEDNLPL